MCRVSQRRIHFLDELRGFCVVLMIFFHLFYVLGYLFDIPLGQTLFEFFYPVQPFFAGIFIALCGLSCNLSHNNLKRGLLLAAIAALISLVMWCAVFWGIVGENSYIWFGILHCLAVCILLYASLRPLLRLLSPWFGILISAALLFLCWHIPFENGGYFGIPGVFAWKIPLAPANTPWLYPLGLCPVYNTADYFPLIPWFFCFLLGSYIGIWARAGKFPKALYRSRVPFLSVIGKHSLWIYALHQPIIYAVCFGIDVLVTSLF